MTLNTDKADHTYFAYQIFTGDLSEDGDKLSNVSFGNGLNTTGQGVLFDLYNLTGANRTVEKLAEAIANDRDAQKLAEALAGSATLRTANLATGTQLDSISSPVTVDGTSYSSGYYKELTNGYYLIIDQTNNTVDGHEGDFYSNFIVEVIKDVVATPKGSASIVDKKIDDVNDSTETSATTDDTDTADYDIGDDVPFVLDATLASSVDTYTSYHVTFEDTLSTNLDNNGKYTINVLDKTIYMDKDGKFYTDGTFETEDATKNTAATTNGTVITVSKETVESSVSFGIKVTLSNNQGAGKKIHSEANGTHVTVSYSAKLVSGATTETNKVKIKYSNNPNNDDEGTSPEDTVTVFTYEFKVNKVDGDTVPLADAKFKLYKLAATAAAAEDNGTTTATGKWEQMGDETEAVAVNPVYTQTTDSELNASKTYYTEAGGGLH